MIALDATSLQHGCLVHGLVILIRYADARYPNLELGACFTVGPTFWTDTGLDAEWAASYAAIYFSEVR